MSMMKKLDPTTEELRELSDEALLDLWHEEARQMSYYNAVESPQWGMEKKPRDACRDRFWRVHAEVAERKLPVDVRGYLL